MKTTQKIIEYIKKREHTTGAELANFLQITDRGVRKHLSSMVMKGLLSKQGRPPQVFYSLKNVDSITDDVVPKEFREVIKKNFLLINPSGKKKYGVDAFTEWCNRRSFNVAKKAEEYKSVFNKFNKYHKLGLISGDSKMKKTFNNVFLDEVFYIDFYSIEVFGKTKLGQMMLYAKQSQDKKLIREVSNEIKSKIEKLLKSKKIEAVGFIPPTVKREVQFMKEIERDLNIKLPKINLSKVKTGVIVPQKTLNKLEDRIENAKQVKLIIGREVKNYKNVLLIDDALGSGATMNEVARQIKKQGMAKKVIGLAITGSFSGFEVISEV